MLIKNIFFLSIWSFFFKTVKYHKYHRIFPKQIYSLSSSSFLQFVSYFYLLRENFVWHSQMSQKNHTFQILSIVFPLEERHLYFLFQTKTNSFEKNQIPSHLSWSKLEFSGDFSLFMRLFCKKEYFSWWYYFKWKCCYFLSKKGNNACRNCIKIYAHKE